ncbi:MAG TPA: hypothetical protein VMG30_03015 [Acidobacteriota bacterium]|nr:hypothetical protein [Acidobacteriota bacterium]
MRKGKTYLHLMTGILVLLFGCRAGYLQASDQPGKASTEVAAAETSTVSNASPVPASSEMNEMRSLIDNQQKQIEKLQSTIEQQQSELDKTMRAVAASSGTTGTSADASPQNSAAPANAVAQNNPQTSSTPASAGQSSANAKPAAGDTSKAAAPKSDLPAALKGFKPIALFYLSYQAGSQYAGTANTTVDYNSFQLKRGYFGADVDLNSYLSARFVSDVTMDSTGDVKLRAKYMYAKFHWAGNDVVTNPYVEFGLAHMPWLDFEEAINGFRMQDTMFLERNSVFNSADIGVMAGSDFGGSMSSDYKNKVDSKYAGRYGSWQIGVYNGGGYHATEKNTNKVFEGRLSIRPVPGAVPGLQFTVFGVVGKGNVAVTNGIQPPDWKSFNGMVSYESQYFTLTGQGYFGTGNQGGSVLIPGTTDAADQRGVSVFAAVHIPTPHFGEKVSLIGRFDEFNANTSTYSDVQRRFIGGVAFHLYKSNILLFDFERLNHSKTTIPGENRGQVTMQVSI